ncbi:MarR family winged helix-turn-helix transcriptional regulator [Dongia deserti]|uniref:MarR family winged helix-turn-helix transcriptional regulator n=1 Tax=Dongia deserti TaxID=2268030 RepID=UPI000E653499|nr:MarR family transcriptional regulator [Dongia deserti]
MQDFIDRFEIEAPRTRPGIHLGDTAGLLRVMRLAAHLERDFAANCAVKPGEFQVLAALRRRDPLPMRATELARAAILTTGAMTAVLDRLEEEGLVRREIDSEDRRARRVTITEKGRTIIDRALDQRMARHRALNAVLTIDERETLSAILRKLLIAVEGEAA